MRKRTNEKSIFVFNADFNQGIIVFKTLLYSHVFLHQNTYNGSEWFLRILCHEVGHILHQVDENINGNDIIRRHHYPNVNSCLMDYNQLINYSITSFCGKCYIKLQQ